MSTSTDCLSFQGLRFLVYNMGIHLFIKHLFNVCYVSRIALDPM